MVIENNVFDYMNNGKIPPGVQLSRNLGSFITSIVTNSIDCKTIISFAIFSTEVSFWKIIINVNIPLNYSSAFNVI